jgi:4-hydroxyphenylpyruvate dioxygenase-like putative hemolysin
MFLLTVSPSEQYVKLEELGILADADDEGVLQIFPLGIDQHSFEIIQRIGCLTHRWGAETEVERSGCGGFGTGNLKELSDLLKSTKRH